MASTDKHVKKQTLMTKKNQETKNKQLAEKLFDNKKCRITCQKVKIEAEKTHDS